MMACAILAVQDTPIYLWIRAIKLEDSYKKQNVKTKNKRELMFLPYSKRTCYLILIIVIFPSHETCNECFEDHEKAHFGVQNLPLTAPTGPMGPKGQSICSLMPAPLPRPQGKGNCREEKGRTGFSSSAQL